MQTEETIISPLVKVKFDTDEPENCYLITPLITVNLSEHEAVKLANEIMNNYYNQF